jgi:hypothetical protein
MPDARCIRGLVCNLRKKTHTGIQGSGGDPTFPRAMVLTVSFVLFPVIGFLATVIGAMRSIVANLTPASRRRNHTTSPSALAPFVKGAFASTASRIQRP